MLTYFDDEREKYVVCASQYDSDSAMYVEHIPPESIDRGFVFPPPKNIFSGFIVDRLAAYEKSGLEPDEIELIKKSKSDYEQGINEFNSLEKELEEVSDEYKALRKRLSHLLESDFINSFDEVDLTTWEYKRDIKEADALMYLDRLGNNDDYAATVKQLEELITDRESFLEGDTEHDDIYKNDIIALKTAISALKKHKGMLEYTAHLFAELEKIKVQNEALISGETQKELDRLKRENKELSIENKCLIYENKILRSEL